MQSLLVDFTRKLTATLIATIATFAVVALSEPTARAQTCQESGEARVWFMNGTALDHQAAITPTPDPGWALVGVGDFNGDGKPDLVWQRENNQGEARVWFMNGTALDHQAAITPNPDQPDAANGNLGWRIQSVGDFNGDGKPDIVWRRADNSGEARIWFMNGTALDHQAAITPNPDPGWRVQGIGDFNGDGKPDLVWRRTNETLEARVWFLNGTALDHQAAITPGPDLGPWLIEGIGDLNADGKADLVWRRANNTGEARIWFMNGTALDHQAAITPNPDPGPWQVVGVGDFNGDGKADFVWRRRSCTSAQLDDSSSGCYFASTSCYGVVEVCHYVCNLHPENNSSSICGACIGLHF